MPIYELYCRKCHMIFNFFSKSVNTEKRPMCPRCRKTKLDRRMSVFSVSKNRGQDDDMPLPDMDESKMEAAMNVLAKEAEHMDEDDPKQAANLMRKLTDMTGLDLGPGMEEAETVEQEMGDILEGEDPFTLKNKIKKAARYSAPQVDEKLYDL